jgi:hypothetical protein
MNSADRAICRIQQQGIEEDAIVVYENLITAFEVTKGPTFAPRGAAGAKPIHQRQAGAVF